MGQQELEDFIKNVVIPQLDECASQCWGLTLENTEAVLNQAREMVGVTEGATDAD